jgi:penicillin-binding protein 1A
MRTMPYDRHDDDPDATLPYGPENPQRDESRREDDARDAGADAAASADAPAPESRGGSGPPRRAAAGRGRSGSRRGRLAFRRRAPRWARWTVPLAVALLLGAALGMTVAAAIHMPAVDSLTDYTPGLITELHDHDGEVFASFARQRRILLDETEVPETLRQALVAVEDAHFYQHGGVDLTAIVRAFVSNLRTGDRGEGASTLTMQLARTLFLTRKKTWSRKIEEAMLAVELEKRFSKQQILTLYMNLINVGHGNYGFAAAARYYFDKDVSQLTLPQAAMLAGIVQIPSRMSPYRRPELVRERRNHVLRRMLQEGYIERPEYEAAVAAPLGVVTHAPDVPLAPYFAEDLRKRLESTYGTDAVHEGGLQVWTTLDTSVQRAAETALRDGVLRLDHRRGWRGAPADVGDADPETYELDAWASQPLMPGRWAQGIVLEADHRTARVRIHDQVYEVGRDGIEWTGRRRPSDLLSRGDVAWFRLEGPPGEEDDAGAPEAEVAPAAAPVPVDPAELRIFLEQVPEIQGAAVVMESATGAVRAMVGGWDFERSKFNRVTQAKRQVGSAFKPFVYGAALEMGYTPADTIFDGPTGFVGADQEISYWPRNHSRRFTGIVTLRYALEHSINVPAVKLLEMIGVQRAIDFARRCGIESDLPPYPSLALGAAEISPIEMVAAYAAIANQGTWVEPYMIERVATAEGQVLERHAPVTRTAIDPRVAYVLTHMLEGVVDRGSGVLVRDLPLDLAGKTGTTDDSTDAWFVGFSPRYTLLAWVGYDVKRSLGRGMTGSRAALPIWRDMAVAGLEDGWLREGESFTPPPGVTFESVEYRTGQLPGAASAADVAGGVIREAFLAGTEPVQSSDQRTALVFSLPWFQQRPFYIPKEGENMIDHVPGDDQLAEGEEADGDPDAG